MKSLSIIEIEKLLRKFPNWEYQNEFIQRNLKFSSFKKTIAFLNEVAAIAELKNHHPKLINNYNSLIIQLSTHDVNGISEKDFDLAEAIDKLSL